ncbi:MAG: aminotransferase class IV [Flavobacteriaceae bacterium]
MVNFNGELLPDGNPLFTEANRAFRYGDCLFETIRTLGDKINFWEDHYLRLMASMRILRMEIPMDFTMEHLSDEIIKLLRANDMLNQANRVRLSVFRREGGLYEPQTQEVSYVISAEKVPNPFFTLESKPYVVELFKEHYLNSGLLSTLKTNNRVLNVVGSVYASENEVDNYILLNHKKQVVEVLTGNIFLAVGTEIFTPPLEDGCINGIIRKKIIEICNNESEYSLQERSISPFELQKADELFITNAITGVLSVTKYRRKEYQNELAKKLVAKLNALARLS